MNTVHTSRSKEEGAGSADQEAAIDKFATLFSPSTPRASPTLEPSSMIAIEPQPIHRPHLRQPGTPSSEEFGSFVSVPALEDPLSLSPSLSPGFRLQSPIKPSFVASSSHTRSLSHSDVSSRDYADNASLMFFDKFAQDAKLASERNKRGVLDELLLHEDDPLYWLKDEAEAKPSSTSQVYSDNLTDEPGSAVEKAEGADTQQANAKDLSHSLMDLDFDFFTAKPSTISTIADVTNTSNHSPKMTAKPTLAPPIASTSSATFSSSPPLTDDSETSQPQPPQGGRPGSYQTLSHISSRWVSSILNPTRPQPRTGLESVLGPPPAHSTSRTPTPGGRRTPAPTENYPHRTHIPTPTSSRPNPFSSSSHVSPFASHVYVPPSGAPGFTGDSYDWDKGFSNELEQELNDDQGSNRGEQELVGFRPGKTAKQLGNHGVGELMEKRLGSVELKGRKLVTTSVLEIDLADLIRPHLPALARLPRVWTLLYSLDQHGISLNTLYMKCEAQIKAKPGAMGHAGALVVVKDAGDGLFGVWMGDGVRLSKGKGYYGSGESFLWKHVDGKFQVFKWTGKNDYVALCEPDFLSFGGGDGKYGLYLDDALCDGTTARCPTFDNEPLCSPGPVKAGATAFECVGLEVWGVGP
ncbi:TLD-domain-containing protein [Infundibulicybe gibba]|nr:TLD-domain-containing protein [Infundibulicybe gibba]